MTTYHNETNSTYYSDAMYICYYCHMFLNIKHLVPSLHFRIETPCVATTLELRFHTEKFLFITIRVTRRYMLSKVVDWRGGWATPRESAAQIRPCSNSNNKALSRNGNHFYLKRNNHLQKMPEILLASFLFSYFGCNCFKYLIASSTVLTGTIFIFVPISLAVFTAVA